MAFTEVFSGIAVADIGLARAWYERLMSRPADMLPNDNEAAWQLAGHGWIYLVGDRERAGKALVTLLVDDLDAQLAGLAERGLEAGPIETLGNGVRKATIADPDGNTISFGGVPAAD
ncbi:MAG TPA: VOC family protein [Thermoleophilaceae bacterium]|jgi:catechol 2,3-dioxygenase-like lactoylglutathione lyase family enzyme